MPEIHLPFDSALTLLVCPSCGDRNTHHTVVDVYSGGENAPVTRTRVGNDDMASISNPSTRRGGLNIGFYCEGCPQRFWLRIEQIMGETYLSTAAGEIYPDVEFDAAPPPSSPLPSSVEVSEAEIQKLMTLV